MKDRLIFKNKKLKNGMNVYAKHMDVPFATAWVYVPVGHANNTGKVLPGTAHFLEHVACNRSRLYPKKNQFKKKVELNGGDLNAATGSLQTEYYMSIRSDLFKEAFKGFISQVFEPLIDKDDIKQETGIILNESKMKNKWYPAYDELGHHVRTKWRHDAMFSPRQRLGNRNDFKKMNVAHLKHFHEGYFDPRTYIIVGGNFDEKVVFDVLSKIKTKKHNLPIKIDQVRWANKEYHEKKFSDINRFIYHMGGIVPEHDMMTKIGIEFIGSLLTNNTHGVLMQWLRDELSWCYDIDFDYEYYNNPHINNQWELQVPLNNRKQVQFVRKEIHKIILKAINDKKLVSTEVERQKSSNLFSYQTLRSILSEADGMLGFGGQLYTEKELLKALERCKDTSFLNEIYKKYWSPEVVGEFLAIPK